MLRDESIDVVPTWAAEVTSTSYREIDRQLRSIAKRRAGLDVEEARWLREAEKQRIWRKLGFSTALEYLEDVFGYSPRTAMERLRVARELGELRGLEAELREGRLPYSAAKELSRVMTPATEARWLERARGKNLRDIEALVAGRKKGDEPDAPQDPALLTRKLVVELPARVDALLQQCRGVAEDELGGHIDDVALLELLCRRFLETPVANAKPTRPAHRIVIHKWDECGRGWQEGRGRRVPLEDHELARAECDAEVIDERGAEEIGAHASRPTPTIPQPIRKLVWTRDLGRCRVPGCRATRNIDIHHIVHRAHGGDHDPMNLLLVCSGHHNLLHDGLLSITGLAPDRLTFVRDGRRLADDRSLHPDDSMAADRTANMGSTSKRRKIDYANTKTMSKRGHLDDACDTSKRRHVQNARARWSDPSNRFDDVVLLEQAKQALVKLGYTRRAARQAVFDVWRDAPHADVATLVRAVLTRGSSAEPIEDGEDPCKLAKQALIKLGYSAAIAARAVTSASAHVGGADLLALIKEALQWCN